MGLAMFLANHPPGDDLNERSTHAFWSVRVPVEQSDFAEALRRLDMLNDEFQCRCGVCDLRSEIYWRMGDKNAAIEALRAAPWSEEMDRFPALAMETMFLYCFFLAQQEREPPPKLVDALPSDYISIQYDGKRVSKADLLALIGRNQNGGAKPSAERR